MKMYGYWRSSASYRVRIALNLKGLAYQQVALDLRTGEQRDERYRTLNPQGLVPTLECDDGIITQSPAILEWLEERHADPPLMPADPQGRATVRAMSALIACDIHPINNLRVLDALRACYAATPEQVNDWIGGWIRDGFTVLDTMIGRHGADFAFGDAPTLADCYLVPQVYSAKRFGLDMAPFPQIAAVVDRAVALPAFLAAHPDRQPDADQ